jgi:hypothetical protein
MMGMRFTLLTVICAILFLSIFNVINAIDRQGAHDSDVAFINWFSSKGGKTEVSVGTFHKMGRGVKAISDLQEGDLILTIPYSMMFCSKCLVSSSDALHKEIAQMWKNNDELAIIGALLLEKFRGSSSTFKEYINVLPAYVPNLSHFSSSRLDDL